ncbi:MAG: hypothetical protein IJD39_04655 [Clostridia bacterium]|nr:hypothetical protein [Clostridia bacterium]
MQYIVLSADNFPLLCLAPDAVALHLKKLARRFRNEIEQPKSPFLKKAKDASGKEYRIVSFNEMDFIDWLNRKKETKEAKIIPFAQSVDLNLPPEWQDYPQITF